MTTAAPRAAGVYTEGSNNPNYLLMINEQLLAHIRSEHAKGTPRDEIIRSLLAAGWQVSDINAALTSHESGVPNPPIQAFAPISLSSSPPQSPTSTASPLIPTQVSETHHSAAPEVPAIKYGGFWLRFAASFIDGILLTSLIAIIVFGLSMVGNGILILFVPTLAVWAYQVLMVGMYQATLGKMAIGLHIERTDGGKIGFGRAFLREIIGRFVSAITLGIGYLMIIWTQKKQGLHDKIADTVVVQDDPNKKKNTWMIIAIIAVPVAIFIVGILSSIVLSALNAARSKGNDAEVKAEMAVIQMQAEIYWGTESSYGIAGSCADGMFASDATEAASVVSLDAKNNKMTLCESDGNAYMVAAPLTEGWWCIDSAGAGATLAEPPPVGSYSCAAGIATLGTALPGMISGNDRDTFVQGASSSCLDSASSNSAYTGIAHNAIISYCSCVSNRIADQTTPAEITQINNLTKDAPLPAFMQDRIDSVNKVCGSLLK